MRRRVKTVIPGVARRFGAGGARAFCWALGLTLALIPGAPARADEPAPDHFDESLRREPQTFLPGEPAAITDPTPAAEEAAVEAEALLGFDYQPHLAREFFGVDETWDNAGYPPDPHIAAGPDHVVVVVNQMIRAFTKDGTPVPLQDPLNSGTPVDGLALSNFLGIVTPPPSLFDPKVVFDEDSQRFFVINLGLRNGCTQLAGWTYIAVSQSSDPAGAWWRWSLRSESLGEWIDYPTLGVSDRAVYFGGNLRTCAASCSGGPTPGTLCQTDANCGIGGTCVGYTGTRRYRTVWIMPKQELIDGADFEDDISKITDFRDEGGNLVDTTRATLTFGQPAGAEAFLLSLHDGAGGTFKATLWGVNLPPAFPNDPPSLTAKTIDLPTPAGPLVLAEQRGGPGLIWTWNLGRPPLEAVYQNGRVWTCSHFGAGATPERLLLRYFEFDVSAWPTLTLASTGTFWDGTSFYYWPEITANHHGDVAMVFSRSRAGDGGDPGEFPGARWTVRLKDESALASSQWLAPGEHYYGNERTDEAGVCTSGTCTAGNVGKNCTQDLDCSPWYRWGDYAGAAVDPVDHGFWLFHEYSVEDPDNADRGIWRTHVGYIPRAVFVDGTYVGVETGSPSRPFHMVGDGHADALGGNDLVIRTGSYPEAVTLDKPVTIVPDGGPVTIGQ
jgi:hypothetical protein